MRKRLPTAALVKSKVEVGGRERFKISRLTELKKDRISSFLAREIPFQRGDVPSTMAYQSCRASADEDEESRWLKMFVMADRSDEGGLVGIIRTRRPASRKSDARNVVEEGEMLTSNIANSWSSKHSDKLRRRTTIVADRYDIAEEAVFASTDFFEDIHQTVGCTTTRENHDSSPAESHSRGRG